MREGYYTARSDLVFRNRPLMRDADNAADPTSMDGFCIFPPAPEVLPMVYSAKDNAHADKASGAAPQGEGFIFVRN